jgi:hypothetical protein
MHCPYEGRVHLFRCKNPNALVLYSGSAAMWMGASTKEEKGGHWHLLALLSPVCVHECMWSAAKGGGGNESLIRIHQGCVGELMQSVFAVFDRVGTVQLAAYYI